MNVVTTLFTFRSGAYRQYAGVFLFFVLCLLLSPARQASSQLVVRDDIPLEELVRKHFIGEGANVSNITRRGWPRSMGWFNGRQSNIGIDEGILLTTGWVGIAPGPNDVEDASFAALAPGDADLSALVGRITFDACVLEFDFIPYQDTVSFEYVFASEEYEEYVGSPFNDVFAFFISGPGITGKYNIARIPGTDMPVAINNVNHITNSHYYINNDGGQTVQYDGFTTVFKALSPVVPCETYRLKLAIADVQDNVLDSGVFLKKGSFNIGDVFEVRALRDAYEQGCQPGLFEIVRGGEINKELTITFQLLGNATEGVDYTVISKTVTFQPGQTHMIIMIDAIDDGIPDDGEMVILFIPDICDAGTAIDTLYIWETDPLAVHFPADTVLCAGDDLVLPALVSGGTGSYRYSWEGYADADSILVLSPAVAGRYRFDVTDTLTGCSESREILVRLDSLPVIDAGPDTVLCIGASLLLGAPAQGGTPPYIYEWAPATGLSNPNIATPVATPQVTTTWTLKVTSALGCVSYDSVTVVVSDVRVDAGRDTMFCRGAIVAIGGEAYGGTPPYVYEWSPAAGLTSTNVARPLARPDFTTTYVVRVRDANGCVGMDSVTLTVSWITIDAGRDVVICPGASVTIGGDAQWSHSPVTFSWSPPTGLDNPFSPTPTARPPRDMTYIVTATNGSGCIVRDTINVTINDLSVEVGPDRVMCPDEPVQLNAVVRGGRAPYSVRWHPQEGLSAINVLDPVATPDTSTWYYLNVIDRDGCVSIDSVRVTVFPHARMRIVASGPTVLCTGDSLTLDAGAPMASWLWNTGETTRSIRVGAEGYYWVQGVSADGCRGVSDTVFIQVTDKPTPIISGPAVVCEGEEAVFSVQDFGAATYQWSVTGGFILGGSASREIRVRWDVSGSYSVSINVILGSALCRGDDMVTVSVVPTPKPQISPAGPLTLCPGDSVELVAPGGFTSYEWSTGERTQRIRVGVEGRYSVTVTNTQGCPGTSPEVAVSLHEEVRPGFRWLTPAVVCEGDSVVVEIDNDYQEYLWSNGATSKRVTMFEAGSLWARVRSSDGCIGYTDTVDIRFAPLPEPVILADGPLEFCEGDSVQLRTSELYQSWEWSDGRRDPSIIVRESGVYSVRVSNDDGCVGESTSIRVIVHPNPPEPQITRLGAHLHAPAGYGYQWLIGSGGDDAEIQGAVLDSLRFEFDTWYRVRIRTVFGCTAISAPFMVPGEFQATSTVGLPILEAAPGDEVILPLTLLAGEYLDQAGVRTFSARLRFDASMLSPVGDTPPGGIDGAERIIDISGEYESDRTLLAELRFVAMLGTDVSTPLILERFIWNEGDVQVQRIDGRLDVRICAEGGERLFDGAGRVRLSQNHPNPFNSSTSIEYEVIERASTQLYVLDASGRRVRELLHAMVEPGAYRVVFDASDLPSGLYWIVLQTPGHLLTRSMQLLK
jgi:hypothetical protein